MTINRVSTGKYLWQGLFETYQAFIFFSDPFFSKFGTEYCPLEQKGRLILRICTCCFPFFSVIPTFEITSCIFILKYLNCCNYWITLCYNHMEIVKRWIAAMKIIISLGQRDHTVKFIYSFWFWSSLVTLLYQTIFVTSTLNVFLQSFAGIDKDLDRWKALVHLSVWYCWVTWTKIVKFTFFPRVFFLEKTWV